MSARQPGEPAAPPDREGAALLAAARSLWPGAEVEPDGRARDQDDRVYALVPRARTARLLVPVQPASAAASAQRRFRAASAAPDVVVRYAAAGLVRSTGAGVLRDRVVVRPASGGDDVRQHLSRVLDRPVDVALGVGSARVNRKPVLEVFDERGCTVAFAKVGDTAQAHADVDAETVALRRLASRSFATLVVPEVLHASTWNGMSVLVLSPLDARASLARGRVASLTRTAMTELATSYAEPAGRLAELPWWRGRRAATQAVVDDDLRDRLLRCLDLVEERYAHRVVEVGAWHGDWTPWNMARRGSRVLLWDWERFETGVPVGLDPWHHLVQSATRAGGLTTGVVRSALARGVAADDLPRMLADLYLVAITGRYAGLAHAERGSDIVHAARTMTAVLEARLLTGEG